MVFNGSASTRKNSSHFNDNMMVVNPDFSNMGYSPIKQPYSSLKGDLKVNFDTTLGQILY